jgi:hypothetical protein
VKGENDEPQTSLEEQPGLQLELLVRKAEFGQGN